MTDIVVDGFGNEIVIGKPYVCAIYDPKTVMIVSKYFGVAVKVWSSGKFNMVNLELYRTERYSGGRALKSVNHTSQAQRPVMKYQSEFVFPVPSPSVTLLDKTYDGFEAAVDIDRDVSEMFEQAPIPSEWQGTIRVVATYEEPQE